MGPLRVHQPLRCELEPLEQEQRRVLQLVQDPPRVARELRGVPHGEVVQQLEKLPLLIEQPSATLREWVPPADPPLQHPCRPVLVQDHDVPEEAVRPVVPLAEQCLLELARHVDVDEVQETVQRPPVGEHLHEHRPLAQLEELRPEL